MSYACRPALSPSLKCRLARRRILPAARAGLAAVLLPGLLGLGFPVSAGGASLMMKSPAFDEGQSIPAKYTCEGENVSPPLQWQAVPDGARSLALIVDDPDAPDPKAPKITWVHWVVYNIPPDVSGLAEHVRADNLPPGAAQGLNSWQKVDYGGPCPPIGRHRYFFKLYALDTVLTGGSSLSKEELESLMQGHVVARYELMGTYKKHQ